MNKNICEGQQYSLVLAPYMVLAKERCERDTIQSLNVISLETLQY